MPESVETAMFLVHPDLAYLDFRMFFKRLKGKGKSARHLIGPIINFAMALPALLPGGFSFQTSCSIVFDGWQPSRTLRLRRSSLTAAYNYNWLIS
jgi:hypothetical protein